MKLRLSDMVERSIAEDQQMYDVKGMEEAFKNPNRDRLGQTLTGSSLMQLKKIKEHLDYLISRQTTKVLDLKDMNELTFLQGYLSAVKDIKSLVDNAIALKKGVEK